MLPTSDWRVLRARVASLSRSRSADDPDLVAARQALLELRLEAELEAATDPSKAIPPLTVEQRLRLADILAANTPINGSKGGVVA